MARATIEALYAAFARLDADTMAACYAIDASFEDEAFTLQGRPQIGAMWAMLCTATRERGLADWKLAVSDIIDAGAHWSARWQAHYRFSATGRLVHNTIDAEFTFDAAGLIQRHRDRFDFWRWSSQALGLPGQLLGWTPFLRNKVRAQAAANLQRFIAKRGT